MVLLTKATRRRCNVNTPQGGSKLQGLPPSVGISNKRRIVVRKAIGDKRHKVFYINQVGGINPKIPLSAKHCCSLFEKYDDPDVVYPDPVIEGQFNVSIHEDTTEVYQYSTDQDPNIHWSISTSPSSANADKSLFTITITGNLSFKQAPAYQITGTNEYNVIIVAVNYVNNTASSQNIVVTVQHEDAPIIDGNHNPSVEENQTTVGTYTATDSDGNTETVTWAISTSTEDDNADRSAFSITTNGLLYFNTAPDYQNPGSAAGTNTYYVIITATNDQYTSEYYIIVTVTSVDPIISGSSTVNVDEQQLDVATYTANETVTWDICGNDTGENVDGHFFEITENGGALYFQQPPYYLQAADSNADNQYRVIIVATDNAGNTEDKSITVIVNEIAPDITGNSFVSMYGGGTLVDIYTSTETDVTWSISDDSNDSNADADEFEIDSVDGTLTFKSSKEYDNTTDNDYYVTIKATNSSQQSNTLAVKVTILESITPIITGGHALPNTQELLTITHPYSCNEIVEWDISGANYSIISPSSGVSDANATVQFIAPAYQTGSNSDNNIYYADLTVTDASSNANTQTIQTRVLQKDPVIDDGGETPSVSEDSSTGFVYQYTADEEVEWNIPSEYSENNINGNLFTIDTDGSLYFSTVPQYSDDSSNDYLVTVQATNDSGYPAQKDVTVTVTQVYPDINDDTTAFNVNEGDSDVGTFTADQSVTWNISDSTDSDNADSSLFQIGSTTGTLTFIDQAVYDSTNINNNIKSVVIEATNTSFEKSTLAITINVIHQDAPTIDGENEVSFEEGTETVVGSYTSNMDVVWDIFPDTTTSTNVDGNLFKISNETDTAGELSFKSAPNYEDDQSSGQNNIYYVTIKATSNDSSSLSNTFAVAVTVTNDITPHDNDHTTWEGRYQIILDDNVEACNYACGDAIELFTYPRAPTALTDTSSIDSLPTGATSQDISGGSAVTTGLNIQPNTSVANYIGVNNGYYVDINGGGYTFTNNVGSPYTHFLVETNIVTFSSSSENAVINVTACNKQEIDILSSDSGIQQNGKYFYRIFPYDDSITDPNLYYNGIQQQTYDSIIQGGNGVSPYDDASTIYITGLADIETLYGTTKDGAELSPDTPQVYFYDSSTSSFDICSNVIQTYVPGENPDMFVIQYNSETAAANAVTELSNSCFYWSSQAITTNTDISYATVIQVNACKFKDDSSVDIPYQIYVNAESYAELNAIPIYVCEVDDGAYETNEILMSNSFIQGSTSVPQSDYQPGTAPPDTTTVFDIDPTVIYANNLNYRDYLPSKFPSADYVTATEAGFVNSNVDPNGIYPLYYDNLSKYMANEPQQTADQCRWLWRMGNYIRNELDGDTDNKTIVKNIVLSSTYAFHIAYFNNSNSLALYTGVYRLTLSDPSKSADVIPPYFTSATALEYPFNSGFTFTTFSSKTANDQISDSYGDVTASINTTKTVLTTNSSSMTDALISQMEQGTGIWPYFDGTTGGGQQLGLAGCGMGCTIPFLASTNFNAMALYDANADSTSTYNDQSAEILTDTQIQAICDAYYILYLRGQICNPYNTIISSLSTGSDTWADQLGQNAYLTNIRIRDVNISVENELSFGILESTYQPLEQSSVPSWVTETTNTTGATYQPCHFPIHAIPDQGWGAVTMEIFTYQGIAAVIRNDYKGFCRWHRMYYYLLFVQNAGYMTNWKNNPTSDSDSYETIDPATSDYGKDPNGGYNDATDANGFLPSYLDRDVAGNGTWVSHGNDDDLKNYSVFTGTHQWPRDWDGSDKNTTNYWANRIYPYRGGVNYGAAGTTHGYATSWTTPCYTVGYSPVWVACGLRNETYGTDYPSETDISNNDYPDPIWEAANPYFTSDAGLYTATDADMNAFIAYTLASLKWTNKPETTNTSFTNDNYDCDVADFDGVQAASTAFNDSGDTFDFSDTGDSNVSIRVDQKIGYGFNLSTTSSPILNTDKVYTGSSDVTRHTTWKYMRTAIARCLVSTNGLAADGNYGNFTNHMTEGKSLVTLGRDTNSSALKIDYIDPAAIAMARETPPGFDVES